jgi:hypothetical protein
MGILFGFRADSISAAVIDSHTETDSTLVVTTPITADPVADAVNNARFACNGFAGDRISTTSFIEMRVRSTFKFQLPEASRITVHGHLTYAGVATLTGRGSSRLFDRGGFAQFQIMARMRVRVRDAAGRIVFTRSSSPRLLFDRNVSGDGATRTRTHLVSAGLLEEFLTVAPSEAVLADDTIFVRMQYDVGAFANDGAEYVLDFDDAGGGLNVPMVVVDF